MTEQELREEFEHEGWCDTQNNISKICNCMISYPLEVIENLQETIKAKDVEIERLNKILEYKEEERKHYHREFCRERQRNIDGKASRKVTKENELLKKEIETLTKLVDSDTKALEKKDQVIDDAKEIIGALWAWFNIKSTRVAPSEYLEKAKK